jgi:hypothetical protein
MKARTLKKRQARFERWKRVFCRNANGMHTRWSIESERQRHLEWLKTPEGQEYEKALLDSMPSTYSNQPDYPPVTIESTRDAIDRMRALT